MFNEDVYISLIKDLARIINKLSLDEDLTLYERSIMTLCKKWSDVDV